MKKRALILAMITFIAAANLFLMDLQQLFCQISSPTTRPTTSPPMAARTIMTGSAR